MDEKLPDEEVNIDPGKREKINVQVAMAMLDHLGEMGII